MPAAFISAIHTLKTRTYSSMVPGKWDVNNGSTNHDQAYMYTTMPIYTTKYLRPAQLTFTLPVLYIIFQYYINNNNIVVILLCYCYKVTLYQYKICIFCKHDFKRFMDDFKTVCWHDVRTRRRLPHDVRTLHSLIEH